jgi:hypothetical protein
LHRNPALLAKAPRLPEWEIEPLSLEEVRRLLGAAAKHRNRARWAVALAVGLRQAKPWDFSGLMSILRRDG